MRVDSQTRRRTPLSAGGILLILAFAPTAVGTPPGESRNVIINYTLVIDPDATDRVQIKLPAALEYEEDAAITHGTRSPSVFVFQVWTAYPHSRTGWHYHPGIVLATVEEGSVDWYDAHCVKHVHKAGDFFMEKDRELHEVRNSNTVPARLVMTFIIEKGVTYKISAAAPSCAKASTAEGVR